MTEIRNSEFGIRKPSLSAEAAKRAGGWEGIQNSKFKIQNSVRDEGGRAGTQNSKLKTHNSRGGGGGS